MKRPIRLKNKRDRRAQLSSAGITIRGKCVLRSSRLRAGIERSEVFVASLKYWKRTRLRISAYGKLRTWSEKRPRTWSMTR